jgi:hypothetical protein
MLKFGKLFYIWGQNFHASPEVLFAVIVEVTVIWDLMPCSLVDIYKHIRGTFHSDKHILCYT